MTGRPIGLGNAVRLSSNLAEAKTAFYGRVNEFSEYGYLLKI